MQKQLSLISNSNLSLSNPQTYPTPRGTKRQAIVKYGFGGLLLFAIILIIWFPLLLFSLTDTVGVNNPPIDCTVEISLGGYQVTRGRGEGRGSGWMEVNSLALSIWLSLE